MSLFLYYSIDWLNYRLADYPSMSNGSFRHDLFTHFARAGKVRATQPVDITGFCCPTERGAWRLANRYGKLPASG
jgi:hypothetical protein